MLPDAHRAPPPPCLRRRVPHPDPAPHPRLHRRRPAHERTPTPASSSSEVFFGEAPTAPRSTPAAAGQRGPEAPSDARRPASRTSYADVVRLSHSYAARGQPPPTYQRKPAFTAGAVTPSTGRSALPPLPATDRWTHRRSRAGPTSPVVKAAQGVPRRTAFGDMTPDATPIHGAADLRRLQADHQPRRSSHSTALPRAAA
jgi:hypothetical protein